MAYQFSDSLRLPTGAAEPYVEGYRTRGVGMIPTIGVNHVLELMLWPIQIAPACVVHRCPVTLGRTSNLRPSALRVRDLGTQIAGRALGGLGQLLPLENEVVPILHVHDLRLYASGPEVDEFVAVQDVVFQRCGSSNSCRTRQAQKMCPL